MLSRHSSPHLIEFCLTGVWVNVVSHISKCDDYSCPVMLAQTWFHLCCRCQFEWLSVSSQQPLLACMKKKEIFPRSSSPLVLIPFYLSSSVMCSASFSLTLPFSIPSFLTCLTPLYLPFQPSLPICPFSEILNYPASFCLAAPPPLCRPPLICLHASSSSPDLVPWPLSFLITHLAIFL